VSSCWRIKRVTLLAYNSYLGAKIKIKLICVAGKTPLVNSICGLASQAFTRWSGPPGVLG
jgi:hypothetical protein